MTAAFTIEGMEFLALDGGPHYAFTPTISIDIQALQQAYDHA